MFRYDKPQKGRFRQFHQFGVEVLGDESPQVDAEVIFSAMDFLRSLPLHQVPLHLNSVGCPQCRPAYLNLLQQAAQRRDRNALRRLPPARAAEPAAHFRLQAAPPASPPPTPSRRSATTSAPPAAIISPRCAHAELHERPYSLNSRAWCAAWTTTPRPPSRSPPDSWGPRTPCSAAAATTT